MPLPRRLLIAVAALLLPSASVTAQVFGTFSWQMQPYCNSVNLSLISMPTGFTVEGLDDQCGGPNKGSAVGTAAFNAGGNLVLNFTIVLPSSRSVHVTAFVSPANGEGTWTDSVGNSGPFRFFGSTPGLPPRPLPASGLPAAAITAIELANGAVTSAKVADRSLTTVDLLDAPRVAHYGGNHGLSLTSANTIVRSVTIDAPSAGKVLALASGVIVFRTTSSIEEVARCSLTPTSAFNFSDIVVISDAGSTNPFSYHSLSGVHVFPVPAAGPFTINLVCDETAGDAQVVNANIGMIFSAQ